jgi:hypothetical protein
MEELFLTPWGVMTLGELLDFAYDQEDRATREEALRLFDHCVALSR